MPKALVAAGGRARLRVLVTSGLATASEDWEGDVAIPAPVPSGIELTGGDDRVGPRLLRASAAVDARDLRWYADGAEIAAGRLLDTRLVPVATRRLSARTADRGSGFAHAVWDLTWTGAELTDITRVEYPVSSHGRSHEHRDHHHPDHNQPEES